MTPVTENRDPFTCQNHVGVRTKPSLFAEYDGSILTRASGLVGAAGFPPPKAMLGALAPEITSLTWDLSLERAYCLYVFLLGAVGLQVKVRF